MEILYKLALLPGIIIGFTIHEYAHARMADYLGDRMARNEGRLTLNPIRHLDFFGFILLLVTGFGWAKAVNFNPLALKNQDRDTMLIAFVGPLSNFILAVMFAILIKILLLISIPGTFAALSIFFLKYAIYVNLGLFLFNMIPIPPLDGSHILLKSLSLNPETEQFLMQNGIYFFLLILFIDYQSDLNLLPIWDIARDIATWMFGILRINPEYILNL